jgi:RNA polymerase sigma factor (sigma-70 family)
MGAPFGVARCDLHLPPWFVGERGVVAGNRAEAHHEEGVMELEAMTVLGTRLSNGDSRAVEDVYEALGPRVLSYLRRRVPYDEAEDVLQRVFFEVWRSRDRYDPGRSLEAWVFAIARRRAIDHLRRPHHVTVPIDLVRDLAGADGRADADNLVWAGEVRRGLDRLPAEQREVLELAYFGGRTQVEIASQLGLPLGTVKARMFRGLRRMGHTMGIRRQ